MSTIFKNQSYLRIELTANVSVSGAKETKIFYQKPSGTVGSVTALVQDIATGVLYYDMPVTSFLDEVGMWGFWTYIKFSDDRIVRGETSFELVLNDEQA